MSRTFQYRIFTGKYLDVSYSDLTKEDIMLNQDFHYFTNGLKHVVKYDHETKEYTISNGNLSKTFSSYAKLKLFLKDYIGKTLD